MDIEEDSPGIKKCQFTHNDSFDPPLILDSQLNRPFNQLSSSSQYSTSQAFFDSFPLSQDPLLSSTSSTTDYNCSTAMICNHFIRFILAIFVIGFAVLCVALSTMRQSENPVSLIERP